MSANGATIAFESAATNLAAGDTNAANDVFVHLFNTGGTFRMSTKAGGGQVLASSGVPALSADGQKVAFTSNATDLVAGGTTKDKIDVFVRNRATDTVVRGIGHGRQLAVARGVWRSLAERRRHQADVHLLLPHVVVYDANQGDDIYRRDLAAGSTTLVSEAMSTATGNEGSGAPMISGDGTTVALYSFASDLVRNDTNGFLYTCSCATSSRTSPPSPHRPR